MVTENKFSERLINESITFTDAVNEGTEVTIELDTVENVRKLKNELRRHGL